MPKALTDDQVTAFREKGFLHPFPCLEPAQTQQMRSALDTFESEQGVSAGTLQIKGHLCFRWSYELSFQPAILDVVEDLIGPDILCFASRFWMKGPQDGSYVPWHQDSAYFGLDPHELVAVWLALTDSTPGNGCVRVLPGSHHWDAQSHIETPDPQNLLARGQWLDGIDEREAVDLTLSEGQFSVHDERVIHSSLPNESDGPRIGLALMYIPAHVRSTIGRRSAYLVRGSDQHHHWDTDPEPGETPDPDLIRHILAAGARYRDASVRQEAASS